MICTSNEKQHTLKNSFTLQGKALHSGFNVELCVKPSPVGTGILFRRRDQEGSMPVEANLSGVTDDLVTVTLQSAPLLIAQFADQMAALAEGARDTALLIGQ